MSDFFNVLLKDFMIKFDSHFNFISIGDFFIYLILNLYILFFFVVLLLLLLLVLLNFSEEDNDNDTGLIIIIIVTLGILFSSVVFSIYNYLSIPNFTSPFLVEEHAEYYYSPQNHKVKFNLPLDRVRQDSWGRGHLFKYKIEMVTTDPSLIGKTLTLSELESYLTTKSTNVWKIDCVYSPQNKLWTYGPGNVKKVNRGGEMMHVVKTDFVHLNFDIRKNLIFSFYEIKDDNFKSVKPHSEIMFPKKFYEIQYLKSLVFNDFKLLSKNYQICFNHEKFLTIYTIKKTGLSYVDNVIDTYQGFFNVEFCQKPSFRLTRSIYELNEFFDLKDRCGLVFVEKTLPFFDSFIEENFLFSEIDLEFWNLTTKYDFNLVLPGFEINSYMFSDDFQNDLFFLEKKNYLRYKFLLADLLNFKFVPATVVNVTLGTNQFVVWSDLIVERSIYDSYFNFCKNIELDFSNITLFFEKKKLD